LGFGIACAHSFVLGPAVGFRLCTRSCSNNKQQACTSTSPVRRQSCIKCTKSGADDHGLWGLGGESLFGVVFPPVSKSRGQWTQFFQTFSCEFLFSNTRWPVKPSNRTLLFFSPEASRSGKCNDLLRNVFYRYKLHREWSRVTIRIKLLHFPDLDASKRHFNCSVVQFIGHSAPKNSPYFL
jgi:hypothetical protein